MICPECKVEFKGNFYYTSGPGRYRRCPNGHEFKEPVKKYKTPAQRAIDNFKAWAKEVTSSIDYSIDYRAGVADALAILEKTK
jgi:hypothetical protein